ncbi:putative DNA-binding ribbon-helix-helix protein [Peteryoungia aggregata LMG 23059]|uniref:DNA-binding ribbon-helix-helix protein n=1 Tax=Peteryoungia aggregata LMG 23059 TaxID=1368425 RepID=A0ABU0G610_9HYPH|nr:ribbon-helix-helix domain-containing protein [Peteryoungia aggregata]MDQ0420780.1 putative DNA-binding ribbon-helix-helix protein [Peteryoungia aggregata LMG 23059]
MSFSDRHLIPAEQTDLSPSALQQVEEYDAEPKFRAIIGKGGTRRGIRLESVYWDGLSWLINGSRQSMGDVVDQAAAQVGENSNLASMLRVVAFRWMWRRLAIMENVYSTENLNTLIQACPTPAIVLTRDKKIQFFNESFMTMLKQRLALGNIAQLSAGFRFVLDTQVDDAIQSLSAKGKMVTTGFTATCAGKQLSGQINLAMAPSHQKQMVIGYVVRG